MRRKDRRGRKKVRGHDDVELNVAAMLDMAFQLLAFFILTFKPSPIESQIMMRLPDKAVTQAPSNSVSVTDVAEEGLSVPISIYSTPEGEIEKLVIGENPNLWGNGRRTDEQFSSHSGGNRSVRHRYS